MTMKRNLLIIDLIVIFFMAACASPAVSPPSTPHDSVPTPTTVQDVDAVSEAKPSLEPQPTATIVPTATPHPISNSGTGSLPAVPGSTLFDVPWDDRSVFAPGLISAEQGALDLRPGASIYHIDLSIDDDLTTLSGREEVRYTNTENVALHEIYFRLFPNIADGRIDVTGLTVNNQPVEPRYELEESVMVAPLAEALQAGEQIVIGMNMVVEIPTKGGGNYGTFATVDGIAALAHFYPMIAVFDDEGWNVEIAPSNGDVVHSDSSYYLVRVNAPEKQKILTSGFETGGETGNGRQTVTFAAGPMRDFYLVSSDRYGVISQKIGETTINAYAPPEVAKENELALRYTIDAFNGHSERYGAYPFTELDVVSTPTQAGGVEYPGIVVVALNLYVKNFPFFEAATAHEVGHQWFYSTVGNDQVDEPWLDESLTQYATLLYYRDVYGQAGYEAARDNDMQRRWDWIDRADIPIGLPVAAYSENGTYSGIIYGRGALFFETLATALGDATFEALMRDYYETFKWDIATTEGFKTLAEKHCQCDLTPLFEEWVYEKGGLG